MIRIGIVGCGRILASHLRGYRLLREAGVDDFEITALCDLNPDDARSKLVTITPKGRKVRDQAVAAVAPLFADLAEVIPASKVGAILPTLQEIRVLLDEARN